MRIKRKRQRIPRRVLIFGIVAVAIVILAIVFRTASVISERNADRMESEYTVVRSPNYDRRPFLAGVDCVVLHATATDTADEAINTFLWRGSGVSAHFVVDRSGKVTQMVPVGRRAWHAGKSRLGDRGSVNDFSVGIEIVNRNDGQEPYTDRQYRAVAGLIRHLREDRGLDIAPDRIVSHRAIALPPGRKSDPLGFDFGRLNRLLAKM